MPELSGGGQPSKTAEIVLRGPLNAYTAYGQLIIQFARHFRDLGYGVLIWPNNGNMFDEQFPEAKIPDDIKALTVFSDPKPEWILLVDAITSMFSHKRTVFLTMHESSQLSEAMLWQLRKAERLLVPCFWNRDIFGKYKLSAKVCPLGVDHTLFQPVPMKMDGPCVIGAAGRFLAAGERKNAQFAIDSFQAAFPGNKDVRLIIKCLPGCQLPEFEDERIQVLRKFLPVSQFRDFLASCHALFLPSHGEAWNLIAQQAAATGRPSILPLTGGPEMFLNQHCCYALDYEATPAQGDYYTGDMVSPTPESAVAALRSVYENRKRAQQLGRRAWVRSIQFPIQSTSMVLLDSLRKWGYITN